MLQQIFLKLLDMSIAAGYCAVFVIIVRFFMKRLPKSYSYVLWALVFVRLLLPTLPESSWSLVPDVGVFKEELKNVEIRADEMLYMEQDGGVSIESNHGKDNVALIVGNEQETVNRIPSTGQTNGYLQKEEVQVEGSFGGEKQIYITELEESVDLVELFSFAWLTGIVLLLSYGVFSHISLARRLKCALQCENDIYELQGLPTAFVVGVIKPRIYLPTGLSEEYRHYVVAHEQTHVQRGDLVVKYITYVLVCIHWFNPLMWISCCLMCRDMEMSCDERVLRTLGMEEKKAYSTALLAVASGRKVQSGLPIAFSESNAKKRIANVLNYKKSSFWAGLVIGAGLLILAIGLLSNPESERERNDIVAEKEESTEERDTKVLAEQEISAQREAIMRNDISDRQVLSEKLSQEFNIGFLYSDYGDVSKTEMDQFHFNAILFDRMDKENFDEDIAYYFDGQNLMEQFCIMTGQEEEEFLKLNEGYDVRKQYFTVDGDDTCAYVTVYDTSWDGNLVEIFYECWAEHSGQHLWDGKVTMRAEQYYMKFVANERDMNEVLAEVSGQSPIAHYRQNIMEAGLLESYAIPRDGVELFVESFIGRENVNYSITLNQRDEEYFYGVIECWNKTSPQFTDLSAIYVRYVISDGILEPITAISLDGPANVGAPSLAENTLFWTIKYVDKEKMEQYRYDLELREVTVMASLDEGEADMDYGSTTLNDEKTVLFSEDLKNIWVQNLESGENQRLKGIRKARLIKCDDNFIILDDNEVEIINMQEKMHVVYEMPEEIWASTYVSGEYLIFQGSGGYISSINVNNIAK